MMGSPRKALASLAAALRGRCPQVNTRGCSRVHILAFFFPLCTGDYGLELDLGQPGASRDAFLAAWLGTASMRPR